MALTKDTVELAGWEFANIPSFVGGLDTLLAADQIDESNTPRSSNVVLRQGRIEIDTGYTTLGSTVVGKPRLVYRFIKANGSAELILITNSTVYKWDSTAAEWQYISNGTSTTLTADANATDLTLTVADITGFADTERIAIVLDTGAQHQTTVNGTPNGSTITITDAMPSLATSGNVVLEAVALAGTDARQVDVVNMAAKDWMIFTNGVNKVYRYDKTDIQVLSNLPSSGNTICRSLAVFVNHLVLLYTTEGGTAYPQRARWCDTGNPEEWAKGNASYRDLYEDAHPITSAMLLGPYLIVYKSRSIFRGTHVGSSDLLFSFEQTIPDRGAISVNAVVGDHSTHYVMDRKGIYAYKGGFAIDKKTFDKIHRLLFDTTDGELDPNSAEKGFMVFIEGSRELGFFYPSIGETSNNKFIRYGLVTKELLQRTLTHNVLGFGENVVAANQTWTSATGSWAGQVGKWNRRSATANAPTLLLCQDTANQVFEYDLLATDDSGTGIAFSFETKDFVSPNKDLRFDGFYFLIKGSTVLIEYSKDAGFSWSTLKSITPGVTYLEVTVFKQIVTRKIRFRFSGTGGGFGLGRMGFKYRDESKPVEE
ncbi:hypothetical protein CMI37_04230 [Candidatus Pacearchaeota archaeon]|nr:hypothetical protein [Candidatus Pacearchaeota archaeon]